MTPPAEVYLRRKEPCGRRRKSEKKKEDPLPDLPELLVEVFWLLPHPLITS